MGEGRVSRRRRRRRERMEDLAGRLIGEWGDFRLDESSQIGLECLENTTSDNRVVRFSAAER